jgi:hypothetical protein
MKVLKKTGLKRKAKKIFKKDTNKRMKYPKPKLPGTGKVNLKTPKPKKIK